MRIKDFLIVSASVGLIITVLASRGSTVAQRSDGQLPTVEQQLGQQGNQQPDRPTSRRFNLKLTLSQPSDLAVKEGDIVKAGQVIADRQRQRQQLESQKAQLVIGLKQLETPTAKPLPRHGVPALAALPSRSFTSELVNIDEQRLKLKAAQQAQLDQVQKLAALRTIDDIPRDVFQHEQAKTREIDQNYQLQVQQLRKAEAQLEAAKRDQARAEYLYQLEQSRRTIAIQRQELERNAQRQRHTEAERDRNFKQSSIRQKIVEIDQKLAELAVVSSPYNAKVHRVKFLEQNDNSLIATVVLYIDRARRRPNANATQQSAQQPSKWTGASGSSETSSQPSSANRWN